MSKIDYRDAFEYVEKRTGELKSVSKSLRVDPTMLPQDATSITIDETNAKALGASEAFYGRYTCINNRTRQRNLAPDGTVVFWPAFGHVVEVDEKAFAAALS